MRANILKLSKLLKQLNLTYEEFANAIGVNLSMVSLVLNGKRNPGVKFFEGFLNFCSVHNLDPNEYISINTDTKYTVNEKRLPYCAS